MINLRRIRVGILVLLLAAHVSAVTAQVSEVPFGPRPWDAALLTAIKNGTLKPARVDGNVKAPRKLRHVEPVYPPIAIAARVDGTVVLEILLSPDGRVIDARALAGVPSPVPLLYAAAEETVRQWAYEPVRVDGRAVPAYLTASVSFQLPRDAARLQRSALKPPDMLTLAFVGAAPVPRDGRVLRSRLIYEDILTALQTGHQLLLCEYSELLDPSKTRVFWHRTQPIGFEPALLASRVADHPFLLVEPARAECPPLLPPARAR